AARAAALPAGTALVSPATFVPSGDASLYQLANTGAPDAPIWQVATLRDTSPSWAIQLGGRTTAAVKKGDTGLLRFRGRVTRTLHETGQGQLRVVVQRVGGDFQRSATARFDLVPEWTEFFVPVRFANNYAAGEIGVYFGFGFSAQTVEIADVSLSHYGAAVAFADLPRTRVTYEGAAPDAAWRRDAFARIEQIRKGDLAVHVLDAAGRPVPTAAVTVEMQQHHFEFGTAAPFSLLMGNGPDSEPYRKALFSIFNAVGPENDLKWPFWAGDRDEHGEHRERTLAALRWLKERDIPVRGHVLVWPGQKRLPKAINARIGTPAQSEIPALITEHIRDITTATAGLVSEWDVLNEPFSHHELMDLFGREIMADWFKAARQHLGPGVPLYFNDWGNHDLVGDPIHLRHFIDTARFILANGGPIDGLGLQAHIGGTPPAPATLLATLDLYQKELGLPVRVTEFDFTTDDPQLHAAYTRDFLIAYFSHPSTAGIQFWGFWEKSHWRPQAALFDANWKETPAGTATRVLLRETWWTRAAGDTDAAGRYAARGFYGRYKVRATLGNRVVETEVRHLPGAAPTAVHLVLP
ncbi:MAG: endo-1,4-beta-xylanase, partial [Burkholderiales bacterium]|nr:endo-1,4-beta-xylanase [Opitutaceae bacterium]